MRVLAVNPGSSSVKLSVLEADGTAAVTLQVAGSAVDAESLRAVIDDSGGVDAAGVRVVHGGAEFTATTRVDDGVVLRLEALDDLAPLHNPPAVAALRALRRVNGNLPVFACFDTAFHRTIPDAAALYALPAAWQRRWPLRRYGFHGLSHAYAARRTAELLGRPAADLRMVTCHLGAGASLCAVRDAVSVDTTMGFTPLEGLVMATRSGSVDPGLLLWLMRHGGLSADELERGLDREGGLLGLSGTTGDLRLLLEAARGGDGRAALAVDVYLHRLVGLVGAMAASAGGLDALVFTGGVGENSGEIRARACARLGHLGVPAAPPGNGEVGGDAVLGGRGDDGAAVVVVHAREDAEIASEVRGALSPRGG